MHDCALRYLAGPDGAALLGELAKLANAPFRAAERLRGRFLPEHIAAANTLLALRKQARTKFERADAMFFTREALEQATAAPLAAWRAARFPEGANLLDLCCGIGGDALALGERGHVFAIDRDPAAAFCCQRNAALLGLGDRVRAACADVSRIRLRADAAFFDPARRTVSRRWIRPEDYTPPLSFAAKIAARVGNFAVKVSPAISDEAIASLGARVEFVSFRGECREAVLWLGELGPKVRRSAALLPSGAMLEDEETPVPPLASPLEFLFEPDAAVIRAHLLGEVARRTGGKLLSHGIAYLTGSQPVSSPFAVCFRILEAAPFNLRRLQARMRALGLRAESVKKRGVPMDAEEVRRALPAAGERVATVVLTRVAEKPFALICERVRLEEETE